jgi:hypothetical protein
LFPTVLASQEVGSDAMTTADVKKVAAVDDRKRALVGKGEE